MAKVFNQIINNRIVNFLDEKNLLPDEQIGFRKQCRTSDHIFILKNIVEKFNKSKMALFISVIDLKQAFDSVNHEAIFLNLLDIGISTNLYNVIKSMYSKTSLTVQHSNYESPSFNSKQVVDTNVLRSPAHIISLCSPYKYTCSAVNANSLHFYFAVFPYLIKLQSKSAAHFLS